MVAAMMRKTLAKIAPLAAAIAAMQTPMAHAGSLSVLPVRVEVAADQQFCSLTIGNDGNQDVMVQVRGFRWYQDADGTDALDETKRIAVNPSIVTIPAGTKKLVRCSLPGQTDTLESTYRLIVNELPRHHAQSGTLQTLLQLSIPVFRAPPGHSSALQWSTTSDGGVIVSNTGTRHARVARLELRGDAGEPVAVPGSFYLLAGASRVVTTDMPLNRMTSVKAIAEDGYAMPVRFERGPMP
ncbi:molecular chaperone [Erythrobacter sp. R86502]|uniref:fimbrial biogenesis chaperone n=1 Tax=Erythrobacter sp. R86502 TaxID=3093846 RepID=UPI0036D3665B